MQKILYVEDDLSLIDGLKYTLENSGYFVDNARTASEALARFKQDTYDLLLLDVTLPDGTGFDVCKEVRAISTIPIIFLTASDQEISIVRGLDIGADDYITKPFKLNELLSRIKAILFCVLELGDGEIGDLMGMSRSAVQRHRTKTLNELQKKLKAHLPEGG